uniref:Uncharacterized protein n=1 Tax=Onchocerca volvulus TaxID=6282 RepID=A0A8R1XVL8_ONCVO
MRKVNRKWLEKRAKDTLLKWTKQSETITIRRWNHFGLFSTMSLISEKCNEKTYCSPQHGQPTRTNKQY